MTHPDVPSPESLLEHREWLRSLARGLLGDENAADDVEQRAWLRVLRNRRPVTSVRGWLRRVVRSEVVDAHRAAARRRRHEAAAARPERLAPERLVELADAQRCVAAAVKALPEPYRSTVLLRYFEELSIEGVASRMQCPVETVRTRLRRAHGLLRDALDREFGDRRAWGAVLLPLTKARPPALVGAATAGAATMATKTWAAAAGIALVAAGVAWMSFHGDTAAKRLETSTAAEVASTRNATALAQHAPRVQPAGGTVAAGGTANPADVVTPPVLVRVRAEDGLPIVGARVLAWRDATIDEAPVGADGTARIVGRDGARDLVVAAPGRLLVRSRLAPGVPETEVVLPAGAAVRGLVRVDGLAPREAIDLTVSRDGPAWTPFDDLPRAIWERLDNWDGRWSSHVPAQIDGDGRFAFGGVRPGEEVHVVIPFGYVFRDTKTYPYRFVPAVAPASEVFVDVLRLPHVTGRVVTPEGRPLSGAPVILVTATDDMGGCSTQAISDAGGRFVASAASFKLKSMSLSVARPDGRGLRRIDVPVEGLTSRDLGDIAVAAVRDVTVCVRDRDAKPVAGAIAVDEDGRDVSEGSIGSDGLATLHVTEGRSRLRVGAAGFLPRDVDVAPDATTIDVVLEGTTLLEVKPVGRVEADRLILVLQGHGPLFDSSSGTYDPLARWDSRSTRIEESSSGDRSSVRFAARQDGSFVIPGLRPGVAVRLVLFDRFGARLAEREVQLAAREHQRVEIPVPEPRALRVRIADEEGHPIRGSYVVARVETPIESFGPDGGNVEADSAGIVSIPDLRSERITLTAAAPDRPCWRRAELDVPASGRELDVRMEKARQLRVTFRDADGQPVRVAAVTALRPGARAEVMFLSSIGIEKDDTGVYAIDDCPAGPVVLLVDIDVGTELRFPVDDRPDVAITLPKR